MFAFALSIARGFASVVGQVLLGPWAPPVDMTGVLGYHVYKSTDQVSWTLAATTDVITTSYTVTGLLPGTWYFKVNSYTATGDSPDAYTYQAVV